MSTNLISEKETTKRFQFIEEIIRPNKDLREQILSTFCDIFGYQKGVFWQSNTTGSTLSNPITLNINHGEIMEYCEVYKHNDPILHFSSKFRNTDVFCYSDFLRFKDFKQTDFLKFMEKNNNHDIISFYINDGNKRTGVISFLRSRQEEAFTMNDKSRLLFLSKYISKLQFYDNYFEDYKEKVTAAEQWANLLSVGIVVIEESFGIRYYNTKALEICNNFSPNQNHPVHEILNNILLNDHKSMETKKSFTLPQQPNIEISIKKINNGKQWMVLLNENSSSIEYKADELLSLLTPREREIAKLLVRGLSNVKIANNLFISINTVKRHAKNIYNKLDVKNKTELCFIFKQ
ncbi:MULTISPECIES: response regulator transcription factor [Paraliobacillus]|uniref:response regulator transcription factor n=1 Tax=Paraliobacillus TaxID=200903 RepID=UPI001E543E74|nr:MULTISPECIES: helix-turn-helix transcriptional regulator [Paraliobacillus]